MEWNEMYVIMIVISWGSWLLVSIHKIVTKTYRLLSLRRYRGEALSIVPSRRCLCVSYSAHTVRVDIRFPSRHTRVVSRLVSETTLCMKMIKLLSFNQSDSNRLVEVDGVRYVSTWTSAFREASIAAWIFSLSSE